MNVHISGKQLEIAGTVRRYVARPLAPGGEEMLRQSDRGDSGFSREAYLFHADLRCTSYRGMTARSHAEAAGLPASFD